MKELFVSYQLAFLLREKKFDIECFSFYENSNNKVWFDYGDEYDKDGVHIPELSLYNQNDSHGLRLSAPLYQQVLSWLRQRHNIQIEIKYAVEKLKDINSDKPSYWYWSVIHPSTSPYGFSNRLSNKSYYDYNEALEDAIKEALNFVL